MLRQAQQRLAALTVSRALRGARGPGAPPRGAARGWTYLRDVVIPRRERILRLTQLEYNAMLRGVFQLIEARQNLARAQREEVLATRDYWVARTELDTALLGRRGLLDPSGRARTTARPLRAPGQRQKPTKASRKERHMISRRKLLFSSAADHGGGAGRGAPPAAPVRRHARRAEAGVGRNTPVVTPNGTSLPWRMEDGFKTFHLIAEPLVREFAPGLQGQLLGLQRPDAGPDDRGRRGRPHAHLRREPAARADLDALARRAAAQRHGRRGRPHPAAHRGRARRSSTSSPSASTARRCTTRTSTRWCSSRWG